MSEKKLKPCPFCGGEAQKTTQGIDCTSCGAFGPDPDQERRGITWNTRAAVKDEEIRSAIDKHLYWTRGWKVDHDKWTESLYKAAAAVRAALEGDDE